MLVVDDDDDVRKISVARLRATYRVAEASTGREAIDEVAKGDIDLLLLDVMMPGMSGIEACRQIKAATAGTFLPVLLLTALDDQANRNEGLQAGADDYVTKPIDHVELKLRVEHLLRLRAQEQVIRRQVAELERLAALRDDLTSLVVHDLRNPLVGVNGALELMKLSPSLTRDDRDMVELAMSSAARIKDLTEDLLRVRMLEDEGLKPATEPVQLATLAASALSAVTAAAHHAKVKIAISGAAREVAVDRKLMLRVLENLLVNAIRHTRESIDVILSERPEHVVVDIADRGAGVPDALKPQLFQKYGAVQARAEGGKRSGHGIGLYLVDLVTRAHKGSIEVLDREGGGAVFRVVLPG